LIQRIDPEYLRRTAQSDEIRALKARGYELLRLKPGAKVIDVGCGPAIDTIPLARLVGPTGFVVGVDADPAMVAEANQLASSDGMGAYTRHIIGNATSLPMNPGEFDACYCERLLQHIPWALNFDVVREMMRVMRPGGRVVIIDTDWATLSIAAQDPLLERRVAAEFALFFANAFSGRYLLALAHNAGLTAVSVQTVALQLSFEALEYLLRPALQGAVRSGRLGAQEVRRWSGDVRAARDYGLFFAHVSTVMLSAENR
jgi:ubiquinone/menaquinone biosynthesis C-methylase UbiE